MEIVCGKCKKGFDHRSGVYVCADCKASIEEKGMATCGDCEGTIKRGEGVIVTKVRNRFYNCNVGRNEMTDIECLENAYRILMIYADKDTLYMLHLREIIDGTDKRDKEIEHLRKTVKDINSIMTQSRIGFNQEGS